MASATTTPRTTPGAAAGVVVIGMDPHKRSVTIEAMTSGEVVLGGGRFHTSTDGYAAMLDRARQWPDRVWAIEGCAGIAGTSRPV